MFPPSAGRSQTTFWRFPRPSFAARLRPHQHSPTPGLFHTAARHCSLPCGTASAHAPLQIRSSPRARKGRARMQSVEAHQPDQSDLRHRGRTSVMKHITIAALAGTAVLFAGTAGAQQGVDFSKVEIKTTDLGNKTYMLEGQGGDITVAVGADGIIMVDTQFAPLHDKIKDAIAKISPLPITSVGTRLSTRTARSSWHTTMSASALPPARRMR